eukprot:754120-Hanusia_phi.AAC.2
MTGGFRPRRCPSGGLGLSRKSDAGLTGTDASLQQDSSKFLPSWNRRYASLKVCSSPSLVRLTSGSSMVFFASTWPALSQSPSARSRS